MLKDHLDKVSGLVVVFAFLGILGLCSCAQLRASTTGGVEAVPPASDEELAGSEMAAQSIMFEFPDIPLPIELKKVNDKSIVIHTNSYQGGLLVLKGRVTVDSLVDFFKKSMPKYGWKLNGTVSASRTLLGFSKGGNAYCLIQIFEEKMGFQTEVQIWLSEPIPNRL